MLRNPKNSIGSSSCYEGWAIYIFVEFQKARAQIQNLPHKAGSKQKKDPELQGTLPQKDGSPSKILIRELGF